MPDIDTQTNGPQLPIHVTPKAHAFLKLEDIPEPINPQDSVGLIGPQASPKPVALVDAQASSELITLPKAPVPFILPMLDKNKDKPTWKDPSVPQSDSLSDLHHPHSFVNTIPAPEWS